MPGVHAGNYPTWVPWTSPSCSPRSDRTILRSSLGNYRVLGTLHAIEVTDEPAKTFEERQNPITFGAFHRPALTCRILFRRIHHAVFEGHPEDVAESQSSAALPQHPRADARRRAALVLGLGAAYLGGGRVADLVPLLLAAWISVFAIFRLYDRAHSRRDPAALVGAALSWAALVAAAAAIYPESGLELGVILSAAFWLLLCAAPWRLLYEQGI